MNDLNKLLVEYVNDPENALLNFNLANYYFNIGQTSSSVSYYIRAAERTNDKVLMYTCLLRASICFEKQGCRQKSVKGLIQNAISLDPKRPEGYFLLSRFYEREKNYHDGYLIASIGEEVSSKNLDPLCVDVDYPGFYGIKFEKAVCSWWCGLCDESCDLFYDLRDNYEMGKIYSDSVNDNILRLFKDRKVNTNHPPIQYNKNKKLRYEFKNYEIIDKNYSQVFQDIFVLSTLDGKTNGTFLEIGGGRPFYGNNTALLEEKFNWNGISIEFNKTNVDQYNKERPNTKVIMEDALGINYRNLISKNYDLKIIDYLQLDIDPCNNTYQALNLIPFDEYQFRVITYEHDFYIDETKSYKEKSRELLKSKGYVLVVDEVSPDGKSSFEDWWVHPDLVDKEILSKMLFVNGNVKNMEDYIYAPLEVFNTIKDEKQTSWIVDNFYESPDQIRKFALEQEYDIGGIGRGYIGNRTKQQFLFPDLKERFENIMGRKITKWEEHGMNGRFQYCWSGQPLVYHCDRQQWGGMLYLTPNAPFECGTTLYAHKKTKARTFYDEGWDYSWKDVPGDPHLDKTPFEPVDVLGNVYNRLVIFDASCIHSASEYFGTVKENCRLWQMFFFDT